MREQFGVVMFCGLLVLSACAPAGMGPQSTGSVDGQAAIVDQTRTLNIITRVEPDQIEDGSPDKAWIHVPLFSATVAAWDLQGVPYPVMAEAVPQLNTDSWRVFPDGRMETTFRLRPGLSWHDGTPLTAEDFVFGHRVTRMRSEWGLITAPVGFQAIEEMVSPDARTLLIRWRQPFLEAPAPPCDGACLLLPFPRHILEGPLNEGQSNAFGAHPFWTTEYVGAGPFRLDRWERGAFIDAGAFDGYALGRPKINRIRLTWGGGDANVAVARLLAGDADLVLDGALRFEQASTLRQQWGQQNTVLLSPLSLRYVQAQARPDWVSPQSLLDARVRKAIVHAIDRPALAEAMVDDKGMAADTIPPPTIPYYSALERVIERYPYDLRRTEQLMAEAGYTKGADGVYSSANEGRFQPEVRGESGGAAEQDTTIVADFLRRAGMDSSIYLLTAAQRASDNKAKGSFPSLTVNNATLDRKLGLDKYERGRVGLPENDWVGGNRSGWWHPEYERLYEQWGRALDPADRTRYIFDMMRLLTTEVASLPLYYNFQVQAHTGALLGPQPHTPDGTRYGNVHEWEWVR